MKRKIIRAQVAFYGDAELLNFPTKHNYWVSINGYAIKISKSDYEQLMYMHEYDDDIGDVEGCE